MARPSEEDIERPDIPWSNPMLASSDSSTYEPPESLTQPYPSSSHAWQMDMPAAA